MGSRHHGWQSRNFSPDTERQLIDAWGRSDDQQLIKVIFCQALRAPNLRRCFRLAAAKAISDYGGLPLADNYYYDGDPLPLTGFPTTTADQDVYPAALTLPDAQITSNNSLDML